MHSCFPEYCCVMLHSPAIVSFEKAIRLLKLIPFVSFGGLTEIEMLAEDTAIGKMFVGAEIL